MRRRNIKRKNKKDGGKQMKERIQRKREKDVNVLDKKIGKKGTKKMRQKKTRKAEEKFRRYDDKENRAKENGGGGREREEDEEGAGKERGGGRDRKRESVAKDEMKTDETRQRNTREIGGETKEVMKKKTEGMTTDEEDGGEGKGG